MSKKIVLLAAKDISTNILYNSLQNKFGVDRVIIENKEGFKKYIRRRIRKLGVTKVSGQILFQLLMVRILNFFSRKRISGILQSAQLDTHSIPEDKIERVESVNSLKTIEILKNISPDIIIVNGTRIISKEVLSSIPCKFINIHAGITPKYRGVHGAYWALVKKDQENCGVSVHFVDKGIDTGRIISQGKIKVSNKDNFVTYPFLQLAEGIKLLISGIEYDFNVHEDNMERKEESFLWYHPSLGEYIYNRIFRKVK